jgi:hypothetical protein
MLGEDIAAKLRRLDEARRERDELDAAAKQAKNTYNAIEAEVWEELEESSLEPPYKIRVGDEVVTFHPQETIYGRVLDEEKARAWIEEQGEDDVYINHKEEFVGQRLNALVRGHLERRKPLPPGIDFTPKRYVKISRQEKGE